MLEAQGVTVVMTRDDDVALAGDDYPDLGCHGPPWRDVNGDGESGFDPEGAIRTRDELQARLDLANLVRADVLVSIHINSLTENGVVFDIAATETFYTDETPWGVDVTAPLAQAIQDGVVAEMDGVADYDRQDRGIQAQNLFIVAPPLLETTPGPARSPQAADARRPDAVSADRGRLDHASGGAGPARLRDRPGRRRPGHLRRPAGPVYGPGPRRGVPACRALEPMPGTLPTAEAGDGPMFWAPAAPAGPLTVTAHQHRHRIVAGGHHAGGWLGGERPAVPARAAGMPWSRCWTGRCRRSRPGESVDVAVTLPGGGSTARGVAWITLAQGDRAWTAMGIPPLQVAIGG